MNTKEKVDLNKKIKSYDGDNNFILSLKSHLKNNKYLDKESLGKRNLRVLSEKQYESAKKVLK